MSLVDTVALAIRREIGTRHQGLPKGGWDGLMKKAAVAAIDVVAEHYEKMDDSAILRASLVEACNIALGAEITRQAAERILELRRIDAQQ